MCSFIFLMHSLHILCYSFRDCQDMLLMVWCIWLQRSMVLESSQVTTANSYKEFQVSRILVSKLPLIHVSSYHYSAAVEDVFKIGSTTPGAILYDAWDNFEQNNPRAEENIRSIRGDLAVAVDTCLEAAGQEFDLNRQETLLKVYSYRLFFC